ncbi:MAG: hypothetical protein KatS3mg068_2260 [Candidatus Sericytochromatia bacterium]|nr:MAG: hypothetical protein KatS3mg068_2260 [Candidatus Sericytochromatia bacterium]
MIENSLKKNVYVNLSGNKTILTNTLIINNLKEVSAELPELISKIYQHDLDLINEEEKTLLGLKIGKTKKSDVLKIINSKDLSTINQKSKIWKFNDIGITLYFSTWDLLEEIIVNSPFQGKTLKGLSIGDSIEKAIKLYGEPKIKSLVSAFWKDLSVFIKDDIIVSIKIW